MDLKRRNRVSAEFSMSSMTDLVFLLLIFFMLASTLVTSSALDLILPKSQAQDVNKAKITVNISADTQFSVGTKIVSMENLESLILQEARGQEDVVVMLRADKSVPYEYVVKVMDIAYRNRLKMIAATDPS
jgi:biopolymer transport protein ExbD